jgi:hypothetical protein
MIVNIVSPKHPEGRLREFWDLADLLSYVSRKTFVLEGEPAYKELSKRASEAASFFNGFFAYEGLTISFESEGGSDVVIQGIAQGPSIPPNPRTILQE